MKKKSFISLFLFGVLTGWAFSETSFWLRNTDPSAEFVYWTIEGTNFRPASEVLAELPLAPGQHNVAPGERVKVDLAEKRTLVGVFVPWSENISFRTVLSGGYLLAAEAPAKGTVLIDRPTFARANAGRILVAELQQWNLSVPQFVLDGRFDDWGKVRPLREWDRSFLAGNSTWVKSWPSLVALQAVNQEGALWIHLHFDKSLSLFPPQAAISLALRRDGGFFEWPLTGQQDTVWLWTAEDSASAVGSRMITGTDLEAWIPWDRMSPSEAKTWTSCNAEWLLLVTQGRTTAEVDLGPTKLGEWP